LQQVEAQSDTFSVSNPRNFGRQERFLEGWYWAIRSRELPRGQARHLRILGRDLVAFRNLEGEAILMDAYCPHMGCHMAEGKVEGRGIRCFFHDWKFDADGTCIEIPSLAKPVKAKLKAWPSEERYGMVWIWTGDTPRIPIPLEPELKEAGVTEFDHMYGRDFEKNCHPNIMMVNAVDAHHFNTVHHFPVEIVFKTWTNKDDSIEFFNTTRGGDDSWFIKLIRPLYKKQVTYKLCYWTGTTGSVTVGPDFFHFHLMFTTRPNDKGGSEGRTIAITKHRSGPLGWLFNRVVLFTTRLVGDYFAIGDTEVFRTIKFHFKTPVKPDQSVVDFMQHVDSQKALAWGDWEPVVDNPSQLRAVPPSEGPQAKAVAV
jgi:phenylpropionate dioxygenase-like ring-hydroxylating dioxygenase large terminal subunit